MATMNDTLRSNNTGEDNSVKMHIEIAVDYEAENEIDAKETAQMLEEDPLKALERMNRAKLALSLMQIEYDTLEQQAEEMEEKRMSNTRIDYMYRDASNYKMHNSVILAGELTKKQIQEIYAKCDDCDYQRWKEENDGIDFDPAYAEPIYFIPAQVGLPEERFSEVTEDDHCWFEMKGIKQTQSKPTMELTAEELYQNFVDVKVWDDVGYAPEYDEYSYEESEYRE